MTEEKLIELCKNGVEYGFELLVETYHMPLYKYISNYTKDRHLIDDIIQDTFIKVINNIEKYKQIEGIKFSTWIFAIAKNTANDELRKSGKVNYINIEDIQELNIDDKNIDDKLIADEQISSINRAMESLSQDSKAMVYLRYFGDLSYKEIANIYDCTVDKVKWRLHDALQKIKGILKKEVKSYEK